MKDAYQSALSNKQINPSFEPHMFFSGSVAGLLKMGAENWEDSEAILKSLNMTENENRWLNEDLHCVSDFLANIWSRLKPKE